jgi:DNA (cytosine-5)-methyltransferase 1
MIKQPERPRAIDLYSGVGGWSLGLRLAGIDVVASYERWGPANETNFKNNLHQAQTVDIRRLSLDDLPCDIELVVGSPPCTQFSFSNRGGGGDLADGLEDIGHFLRIVDHLKPRLWAMENVPRAATIIQAELKAGGVLEKFAHLGCETHIVDMTEYGLPQRRRRCIAGNFDIELLRSYRATVARPTLGDIVNALASDPIIDPLFGVTSPRSEVSEHIEEDLLSVEEVRINRANKMTHTVYNAMPFPDPLDRSVRTITATCTRVSRESIVIEAKGETDGFRRLTPRERASLQGFPITFQFYGSNYSQKLRMIGNAVPPPFAYLMGHVLQGHELGVVPALTVAAKGLTRPTPAPVDTPPDRVGGRFRSDRTFKFAIPSLQLKSGVRFEFCNRCLDEVPTWRMAFYFGTSKAIKSLALNEPLAKFLADELPVTMRPVVAQHLDEIKRFIKSADIANMQAVWSHKGPGGTRAFMVLDKIDEIGGLLARALSAHSEVAASLVAEAIQHGYGPNALGLPGLAKLARNAPLILAGLLVGSAVNPILAEHANPKAPNRKLASVSSRG